MCPAAAVRGDTTGTDVSISQTSSGARIGCSREGDTLQRAKDPFPDGVLCQAEHPHPYRLRGRCRYIPLGPRAFQKSNDDENNQEDDAGFKNQH